MMQEKKGVTLQNVFHRFIESLSFREQSLFPYFLMVFFLSIVLFIDMYLSTHPFWPFHFLLIHSWFFSALHLPVSLLARPVAFTPAATPAGMVLFVGALSLFFLLYLLVLRSLPKYISYRSIVCSTLCLGGTFTFIPIVTSQDVFSYIAYARIYLLYHLNPFTTLPAVIHTDTIYPFLYWTNQPSVYGPIWIMIVSALQWLAFVFGLKGILTIQMLLRFFGLCIHLSSVLLIWSISGKINQQTASPLEQEGFQKRRLHATLAFAWNPFLLLEACVNTHSDTTILFLILLALWCLCLHTNRHAYLAAAILLVMAAAIKITFLLLIPGFLLFLLTRKGHLKYPYRGIMQTSIALLVSLCTLLVLYLPFWQQGALFHAMQMTPAASRDVNSIYELLVRFYSHLKGIAPAPDLAPGTYVESLSHQISICVFAIVYVIICWRSLLHPQYVRTFPALVRWMALVWLLYCIIGSPWFWPWYTIVFFGLVALIECEVGSEAHGTSVFEPSSIGLFSRVLGVSMLSMYCFGNWTAESNLPFTPHVHWMYMRGLWIWLFPFLVLCWVLRMTLQKNARKARAYKKSDIPA